MEKFLDIKKIKDAQVFTDYFPFFEVKDGFRKSQKMEELLNDLPDINQGGSYPTEGINSGIHFRQLVNELKGKELKYILEEKFELDLSNTPSMTTFRGFSKKKDGQIHVDSRSKLVTLLLYLNKEWNHENGNLRLLKNRTDIEGYFAEIPATIGSLVAFKVDINGSHGWHGYKGFEGKRLSLQLNYIHEQSIKRHKLIHFFSSKVKQVKDKLFK